MSFKEAAAGADMTQAETEPSKSKHRQQDEDSKSSGSSAILDAFSCIIDCEQAFSKIYLVLGVITMGVIYFNFHFADYYVCNEDLYTSSAEASRVVPLLAQICAGEDKFYNTLYVTAMIVGLNAVVVTSIEKVSYSQAFKKAIDKIETASSEIAPVEELNSRVDHIIKSTIFKWSDLSRVTFGGIGKFAITFLIWYFVYGQTYDRNVGRNVLWMLRSLTAVEFDFMRLPSPYNMSRSCSGEFPWVGRVDQAESHYYTVDCLRSRLPLLYCVLAVSEIVLFAAIAVYIGAAICLIFIVAGHATATGAGMYLVFRLASIPHFIELKLE